MYISKVYDRFTAAMAVNGTSIEDSFFDHVQCTAADKLAGEFFFDSSLHVHSIVD